MEGKYILMLQFDSDNPEFTRGFEAGIIYNKCQNNIDVVDQNIHASNSEMVIRICELFEKKFVGQLLDDDWMCITIT